MSREPLLEAYVKAKEDNVIMKNGAGDDGDGDDVVEIGSEQVGGGQSSWLVIRWGKRRLVDPLLLILSRGLRPKQLAASASLGFTFGIFPVYGVTVVISAIVGALLRSNCNIPTLMLANLVATPLQLGLVVPFLRLGEWVSGGKHFSLTPNALWMVITGKASDTVLFGLLHSLIGWAIMAPPIFGGLYVILCPLFWCLIQKFGANPLVHTSTFVSPQSIEHYVSSLKDPEI